MTAGTPSRSLGRAAARARESILELIESGVFPPASKLPGERDLAEQVSVSRVVLREALTALAAEGRLESSPWRGWFVTSVHMAEQVTLKSFTTIARERGLRPGARVVRAASRAATREELAQLRLARLTAAVDLYRALGGGWSEQSPLDP
jgi:GntR family transcriptional regulator